jgi:alkylhydroperoxidase/carboxymuconolactone decarboxylase family protein YurZ
MYLPKIYKDFSEKFPEVLESYQQLGQTCSQAGPLTEKNQNLVQLGISIGANSRGAVMSHTRRAIDAGATKEEINHVVLLAMTTTGFPNMMAAMRWVSEVIADKA